MSQRNKLHEPPFETVELRKCLTRFLDTPFNPGGPGSPLKIGSYRCGVYAFYDYDGEPIYVGQTNEKVRVRIRRHLTNQRTDAVAMSVLDPFEVYQIEVWPLPQYQHKIPSLEPKVRKHLDALENKVYGLALSKSKFNAVLNEKNPPPTELDVELPKSFMETIVSDEVYKLRSHPDLRIARRASVISKLAQVISERKVQGGLRRVLFVQAERLRWLAQTRYEQLGGASTVPSESNDEDD